MVWNWIRKTWKSAKRLFSQAPWARTWARTRKVSLSDDMNKKFIIKICINSDDPEMIAFITFDTHYIASIKKRRGTTNLEIEIFAPVGPITSWFFPLNDFLDAIAFAKKQLVDIQKIMRS
jgi:hypothetical protein